MTTFQKMALEKSGKFQVDLLLDEPLALEPDDPDWRQTQLVEGDLDIALKFSPSRFTDCLRSLEKLYPFSRRLVSIFKTRVYDIIICGDPVALPIFFGLAGLAKKVPLVYHIHTSQQIVREEYKGGSALYVAQDKIARALMRDIRDIKISCGSEPICEEVKKIFGEDIETCVLPAPITMKDMRKPRKFSKTEGIFWSCSTEKDHHGLGAQLFKEIHQVDKSIPLNFHIIGQKPTIEKQRAILPDKVKVIEGLIPRSTLMGLIRKSRIGISTSLIETYGLVALEHLYYHPLFLYSGKKLEIPWTQTFTGMAQMFRDNLGKAATKIVGLYHDEKQWNSVTKQNRKRIQNIPKKLISNIEALFKFEKEHKETRLTKIAAKKLKEKKVVSVEEILTATGWKDIVAAHHTFPYLKSKFVKLDCDVGTCYSLSNDACDKCVRKGFR